MSTEKQNVESTKAQTRRYININAYYDKLQDFFNKMVKQKKCAIVPEKDVIGNFKGITYKFLEGKSAGHWAQLRFPKSSTASKPTLYLELDPQTREFVKGDDGKPKLKRIWDAAAAINGMENIPSNFSKVKDIVTAELGFYDGSQIGDYDQKTDVKAFDEKKKERALSAEELVNSQNIRDTEITGMITQMISEIEQSGTLYGKKAMQIPLRVSALTIGYAGCKRDRFPDRLDILEGIKLENGEKIGGESVSKKTNANEEVQYQYRGPVFSGLQYVAAMQNGQADSRYVLESDLIGTRNLTRLDTQGRPRFTKWPAYRDFNQVPIYKMGKHGKPISVHYACHKDFGIRKMTDTNGNDIPWENVMLRCVYIDHAPQDHFNVQRYINVSDIVEKPLHSDIAGAVYDHTDEVRVYPLFQANGNPKIEGIIKSAERLYGKSVIDKEAFEKDPVGAMRNIIFLNTENHKIREPGMRALQRELTLDRVLRRCGWQEGIEIPAKDRQAIVDWLKKDLERGNDKKGNHFINALTAMDRNNAFLMGASREEQMAKMKEVEERPKFVGIQIEMQSDYTLANGNCYPAGAGGSLSRPIVKEEAYGILRDICFQDKELFGQPEAEKYHKTVKFNLTVGDTKYEGLTVSLGSLDTGNEKTVADSLINLITKSAKEDAYQRERINRKFDQIDSLRKAGLLSDEVQIVDRVDVAREQRAAFESIKEQTLKVLDNFKQDEVSYLAIKKSNGERESVDISKDADVFRYAVPTRNKTLLYEALGTGNIVKITDQKDLAESQSMNNNPYAASRPNSLIIELRKPLEPLLEFDKETQQSRPRLDSATHSAPIYFDPVESRARATASLEATPYLKDDEIIQNKRFNQKFSVDCYEKKDGEFVLSDSLKGSAARNALLEMAAIDEAAWQQEKAGQRSVNNLETFGIDAKWDGQTIFKTSGRMGEKAFSNGSSIEEILSSQKAELSEEGKKALAEMLGASNVEQKYSTAHDLAQSMKNNELVNAGDIQKVISKDKKVADLPEEFPRVDRLEVEAKVNNRESMADTMDYIVGALIKETKAKTLEQLKQVKAEIVAARPDQATEVDKSMQRVAEAKKISKGRMVR